MGKLDMTNPRQSIIAIQPRGIRTGARLPNPGFGRCGCNINNRRLVRSLKYTLLVGNKHGVSVPMCFPIDSRQMHGWSNGYRARTRVSSPRRSPAKEGLQKKGNTKNDGRKEIKNNNFPSARICAFPLIFPSHLPFHFLLS